MQSNAIEHALEEHSTEHASQLEMIPSYIWVLHYSWRETSIIIMPTRLCFPAFSLRQRGNAAEVSTPLLAFYNGIKPFKHLSTHEADPQASI